MQQSLAGLTLGLGDYLSHLRVSLEGGVEYKTGMESARQGRVGRRIKEECREGGRESGRKSQRV